PGARRLGLRHRGGQPHVRPPRDDLQPRQQADVGPHPGAGGRLSRRAWAAFVTVAILWGVPYLFIQVAVADVSPVVIAWVRVLIAALVLLQLALSGGELGSVHQRRKWVQLL